MAWPGFKCSVGSTLVLRWVVPTSLYRLPSYIGFLWESEETGYHGHCCGSTLWEISWQRWLVIVIFASDFFMVTGDSSLALSKQSPPALPSLLAQGGLGKGVIYNLGNKNPPALGCNWKLPAPYTCISGRASTIPIESNGASTINFFLSFTVDELLSLYKNDGGKFIVIFDGGCNWNRSTVLLVYFIHLSWHCLLLILKYYCQVHSWAHSRDLPILV